MRNEYREDSGLMEKLGVARDTLGIILLIGIAGIAAGAFYNIANLDNIMVEQFKGSKPTQRIERQPESPKQIIRAQRTYIDYLRDDSFNQERKGIMSDSFYKEMMEQLKDRGYRESERSPTSK